MWIDIASILFVCVTVNHLGLIGAIEETIRHRLPVVNCPKCLTFWMIMVYSFWKTEEHTEEILAISFMASYAAMWLELAEGYIDTLYLKLYEKIFSNEADTPASDADNGNSDSTVS